MKLLATALIGASFVYAVPVVAQTTPSNSTTAAPMALAPASDNMLRTGTKVPLKLSEALTTKGKKLRVGQHFQLEVAEPVIVNGQTIIPVGSPAVGEVTDVRNKGMWGKSGHLTAQVLYVTVNGRQVKLNGTFDDKGTTGTAGVVAAVALLPVAGFFTTGTSATIPVGAPVTGFVAEDVPLTLQTQAPMPLVVGASASAPGNNGK